MKRGNSDIFDHSCNLYPHYLDTVLDGLQFIKVGKKNKTKGTMYQFFTVQAVYIVMILLILVLILPWRMIYFYHGVYTIVIEGSQSYLIRDVPSQ